LAFLFKLSLSHVSVPVFSNSGISACKPVQHNPYLLSEQKVVDPSRRAV